mgnify:CR=1 FL=1
MDAPDPAEHRPAPPPGAALQGLLELKQRLQLLHTELEYLRLLMKLGVGRPPGPG